MTSCFINLDIRLMQHNVRNPIPDLSYCSFLLLLTLNIIDLVDGNSRFIHDSRTCGRQKQCSLCTYPSIPSLLKPNSSTILAVLKLLDTNLLTDLYSYRPPRGRSEGRESEVETKIAMIPPGTPYLTKVNGKLVMAREKKGKSATLAIDLLGEAFGVKTRVIRKRAKSLDKPKALLLIGGVPYVPQQQLVCTAPLPQQTFPPSMVSMPQYQQLPAPQKFTVPNPNPTKEDFEQLKRIGAHYHENFATKETKLLSSGPDQEPADEVEAKPRAIVTITKHICENCGRLRSKKYHHNNPIKPGENPPPAFCKKCQKDASSTSDSDTSERPPKTKQKKKKTKTKKKQTVRS